MNNETICNCHDAGEQKAIKAEESFDTSRKIGVGRKISYQWKKSDSLCAHASTKELITLAKNHSDIIQRLIAFRALLTKAPHEAVNLAISEIEDTTKVMVSHGVCATQDIVSNIRIDMIQYQRKHYKVSLADSMRIDSALLFSNITPKFYYMYDLYHRLPAKPEYEKRLEQLYGHDHYALIALAKYHRVDTKQEIIRLLSILGALMAYNDRWSYNLIDKTLSKAKQKDQNYYDYSWGLYEAYHDNPLPLFKPLYKKYAIEE